jgi:hypothetical protein
MELRYWVTAGFTPALRDRLSGMTEHAGVLSVELRLTGSPSTREASNQDLGRAFASVVHGLAGHQSSRVLFRYDLAEVVRKLKAAEVPVSESTGWLIVDVTILGREGLTRVLESVAFTTSYFQAGGAGATPASPVALFNAVEDTVFLATFTLYDDAVEIVSAHLTADVIFDVVHRVAKAEGITVIPG